jgi:hypothetical protein
MKRLEARVATGLPGADLTVFVHGVLGQPGWFLFDSANLDLTQVAPHMLPSTGSTPPSSSLLTLDGLPPLEVPTRVREIIHDGVLAESFLSRWVWTFRLATGEVWAAPVRKPRTGALSGAKSPSWPRGPRRWKPAALPPLGRVLAPREFPSPAALDGEPHG